MGIKSAKRQRFEGEVLPELNVLFAAALYLSRSQDEANDLCEKTMVRAYRAFNGRIAANCRSWLLSILHDIVRAESLAQPAPAVAAADTASVGGPAKGRRSVEDSGVDRALQSLPADCRAAVVMVDVANLNYGEAAKVLAIPVETLRAQISRGRALMRNALAPLRGPGGLASA
ncbi:MAG TPA: sigma factor-like helix-turn-helix DNA-binding protein [Candidatus Binataceae bacterium]|nr:sigma factor-like helix-turn-helix DNA-binding protein [Candidatus Binataceae bacterium]